VAAFDKAVAASQGSQRLGTQWDDRNAGQSALDSSTGSEGAVPAGDAPRTVACMCRKSVNKLSYITLHICCTTQGPSLTLRMPDCHLAH
jgi:hypothetical protein